MEDQEKIVQTESQLFRIYELQAELNRGHEQYSKMIPQYEAVLKVYDTSKLKKKLPDGFCEQFEKDLKDIRTGLKNIDYRLTCIKTLLDKASESPESREIVGWFVTIIFNILGMGLSNNDESKEETKEENAE